MNACSVIIVNYNTGELLKLAIDAALDNDVVNEIFVVDNDSKDHSMDLIEETERVKKIYRTKNYGFASSCNFGAALASTETLVFLNPDCIVEKNTFIELLTELQSHDKAGIVGCLVNNPDGSEQRASRRRLPTLFRAVKTFTGIEKLAKYCHCFVGVNLNHQPMPVEVKKVEAISGAFIMIKNAVFKSINGFDDKFKLHFEDLDLFKRTINSGYEILFNPQVTVTHYQGTSSQSNPKVEQLKKSGRQRYFKKHLTLFSYWISKIL